MSFISNLFASSDNPDSLGARLRNKRQKEFEALFYAKFKKTDPVKILDVGGTDYFWKNSSLPKNPNIEITLLNLSKEEVNIPRIKSVVGDATHMPEFSDNSFDLVFSNSVIEHLYTWENQLKMANEIQRVGKLFFVQTPNKYFPIEAHYAIPFAQFMPKSLMLTVLTKTRLSRLNKWNVAEAKQYLDEILLIDKAGMKKLFPGASIFEERMMGMVKSFSAHNLV